jgi:hypothetical protein
LQEFRSTVADWYAQAPIGATVSGQNFLVPEHSLCFQHPGVWTFGSRFSLRPGGTLVLSAPRNVFGCGILIFENAFGRTRAMSCVRTYRTLRDGSFEGRFSRHFVPGYDHLSLRDALADISQQHLAKACCEKSRRDGAIVAWHEVPGKAPPPREPSRRVRCDSRRCGHRLDVQLLNS